MYMYMYMYSSKKSEHLTSCTVMYMYMYTNAYFSLVAVLLELLEAEDHSLTNVT